MKARWRRILEGSREEALLAVTLYNQPGSGRRLEAFYIHMHLAWLCLFHARLRRDGVDYRYRQPNGRFVRVDGEPKTWSLTDCIDRYWRAPEDPVRKNLELTVALRNKIEHRYEEAIAHYTAGYSHALLLNYEEELLAYFGPKFSLRNEQRLPLFLSTLTVEGIRESRELQRHVPAQVQSFVARFEAGLDSAVTRDLRFEFRIHLVPQLAPKGQADMALRFVREEELTDDQREALKELGKSGRVIVRERVRGVVKPGLLKPSQAAAAIENRIPFKFSVFGGFLFAWRNLAVRPPAGAPRPERTDERYCIYDSVHGDYLYTPAYVERLIRECGTREGYEAVTGRSPVLKDEQTRETRVEESLPGTRPDIYSSPCLSRSVRKLGVRGYGSLPDTPERLYFFGAHFPRLTAALLPAACPWHGCVRLLTHGIVTGRVAPQHERRPERRAIRGHSMNTSSSPTSTCAEDGVLACTTAKSLRLRN